jgi:hypothetical protein
MCIDAYVYMFSHLPHLSGHGLVDDDCVGEYLHGMYYEDVLRQTYMHRAQSAECRVQKQSAECRVQSAESRE